MGGGEGGRAGAFRRRGRVGELWCFFDHSGDYGNILTIEGVMVKKLPEF